MCFLMKTMLRNHFLTRRTYTHLTHPFFEILASAKWISTAFISIEITDIHVAEAEILNNSWMIYRPVLERRGSRP